MFLKKVITFLLLFCVIFSYAQQSKIDSLFLQIDHENDSKLKTEYLLKFCKTTLNDSSIKDYKINIEYLINEAQNIDDYKATSLGYQMLSEKFRKDRKFKEAMESITKSIKINSTKGNDSLLIKDYSTKAGIYNHFQKYDSAVVNYNKAINLSKRVENSYTLLGYAYNGLSSVLANQNKLEEAIKLEYKAIDIAEKYKLLELEILCLVGVSWKLMSTGNNVKSLEHLHKALEKFDNNISDKEIKCDILRFLGLNYSRSSNYVEAFKYNEKALECYRSTGNKMFVSDILNTLGTTHLRLEEYKQALPYFEESLKIDYEINSLIGANFAKINLSSSYINLHNFKKSKKLLFEVLQDTINQQYLPKRIEKVAYQNLAELYELKNDYKSSLKYMRKFKHLEDSLNNASLQQKITEIDTKYQTEKKEKENFQLKVEKSEQALLIQKANTQKWIFAMGLFIVLLIALYLISLLFKRKKELKVKQYKYTLEVNKLNKLKEEQQNKIKNQSLQIDNLEQTIQEREEFLNTEFKEKEKLFHHDLSKKYNLTKTKALLQYWVDQSKGVTEKEMIKIHNRSAGAIEGRRKRLYEKIKETEDIDSNIWLSKEDSTRIYRENWQEFNK